jgi:hypothetical protein
VPRADALGVSNQTSSLGVAEALAQVAEVANVLGVALVGPNGDSVAHNSQIGLPASTFAGVAERVHSSLNAFESLEAARSQALALYFESATVLVRWVEDHVLVVVGTEQVHPTVLSVSLNAAASTLHGLAKQGGGAALAFRLTGSGLAPTPPEVSTGIALKPTPAEPLNVSGALVDRESYPQVDAEVPSKPKRVVVYRGHKVEE